MSKLQEPCSCFAEQAGGTMPRSRKVGSPYLSNDRRLADVIAAIQAMGSYKFYKLDFSSWADRITADRTQADHWRQIFEEHPEFFRLDGARQKASLVLRRQHPRLYSVDLDRVLTNTEYEAATLEQKARLSRMPLSADEIGSLVQVAINLHSREADRARDARWWIPVAASFGGAVLGSLIGAGDRLLGALARLAN